jgi:hypothetical protein
MAPHVNVLVNGMYWDQRYPRLLTKSQVKDLYSEDNNSFLCLADISCDIGGSVEFLEKSTTVEMPYFHYDPLSDTVSDIPMSEGISVMGVDILPSELPRESSKHFGDALMPLLHEIVGEGRGEEVGEELKNACITAGGQLAENFRYIDQLKRDYFKAQDKIDSQEDHLMLELDGHLFDSGLINHVLDLIESNECKMEIVECNVGGVLGDTKKTTQAVLKVSNSLLSYGDLRAVAKKVEDLVELLPNAEAKIKVYGGGGNGAGRSTAKVTDLKQKQVRRQERQGSGVAGRAMRPLVSHDVIPPTNPSVSAAHFALCRSSFLGLGRSPSRSLSTLAGGMTGRLLFAEMSGRRSGMSRGMPNTPRGWFLTWPEIKRSLRVSSNR